MTGYTDFIKNNCNTVGDNDQCSNSKLKENNFNTVDNVNSKKKNSTEDNEIKKFDELKNHKIVETKDIKKNIREPKVKRVKIEDLSVFSDEESDVDVIQIITPEKKDRLECNIKIDKNMKNTNKNKKNNIEIIHTIAGTWHASTESIHTNSKKKKMHKDVDNAFKTVETLLKNEINDKLVKLNNKVEIIQPSKSKLVKQKSQNLETKTDCLKINNKRRKAEFNAPLYENDKTLGTINKNNAENSPELNTTIIIENSTKQLHNIDPSEFLQVTQTNLETEEMTRLEDHLDDKEEDEQEKLIAEAFADDDIINEFK